MSACRKALPLFFRLVHSECDESIDPAVHQQGKNDEAPEYTCPICKYGEAEVTINI